MNAHHGVGELEHGIREVRPGRAGHAGVVFAALHQLRGDLHGVGHVAPRSPRVDAGQGDVARRRVRAAQPDADALPFVPVPPRDHAGRLMRGHGDASVGRCDDEMRFRASSGRFRRAQAVRADYKISGEPGGLEMGSTAFEPAKILRVPSRRYRTLHRPDATGSSCSTSSAPSTPWRRTRWRTPSKFVGETFAEVEPPAGSTTLEAATTPAVSPPAPPR